MAWAPGAHYSHGSFFSFFRVYLNRVSSSSCTFSIFPTGIHFFVWDYPVVICLYVELTVCVQSLSFKIRNSGPAIHADRFLEMYFHVVLFLRDAPAFSIQHCYYIVEPEGFRARAGPFCREKKQAKKGVLLRN